MLIAEGSQRLGGRIPAVALRLPPANSYKPLRGEWLFDPEGIKAGSRWSRSAPPVQMPAPASFDPDGIAARGGTRTGGGASLTAGQ